jgi:CheY-like chemotaxis protein
MHEPRGKRILLADDDPLVRSMFSRILRRAGYEVLAVENGLQVLKAMRDTTETGKFDLLVLDIVMPEMEGLETIREMRTSHPDLPILAISGAGAVSEGQYLPIAAHMGAQRTLQKPVRNEVLLETIAELIA